MILMPSNNTGRVVRELFEKYPDRIALLLNPNCLRPHQFKFKYAVDNAAFKKFNEYKFFKMVDACPKENPPIFIVVPDVVGCHDRTLALWNYYEPRLRQYSYPLAFVAQDGCDPGNIPRSADWIFIGGTNIYKFSHIKPMVQLGKPIHVGRVNSIGFVRYCESVGVTSIDGTGWMRAKGKQYQDFLNYFNGEDQISLWPADQLKKYVSVA